MRNNNSVGIKAKLLIIIIPLLICSFFLIGYISVSSSRRSLSDASIRFMKYKSGQIQDYSSKQWQNLQNSSLADEPVYFEIVKRSIGSYVGSMIRNNSELIFALDDAGTLIFSTSDLNISDEERKILLNRKSENSDKLLNFQLAGRDFVGLTFNLLYVNWQVFLVEDELFYFTESRMLTYRQIFAFAITLVLVISGVVLSLTKFTRPLLNVHKAIEHITLKKDFSRKIRIEYPDEIGVLAYDFNNMTTDLDLSYKKLKKYAMDEAVARKEVAIREEESLQILGRASDYKDPETGAHIVRVSHYSLLLSQAIGHDQSIQDLIFYSSPLHDIGKLGIPDSILLKQGKLTEDEFSMIKTHTTIGYEILQNTSGKYLKAGAIIALSHHEKFDGTGYPKGIIGEDIPILGRITSIVDVFDALTTRRPYKEPWSFEDAASYIYESRGTQFDPNLVDLFMQILPRIKEIYNRDND